MVPVFESPIINSRWPCPIGTKLSTTFKPVSKGVLTEDLSIIEGALVSTLFLVSEAIVPLLSKGSPNGLQHDLIERHLQVYSLIHLLMLQINLA